MLPKLNVVGSIPIARSKPIKQTCLFGLLGSAIYSS